jgi:hypothetical protein
MMRKIGIITICICLTKTIMGQGCSDAGFCSAGFLKSNQGTSDFKNAVGFSLGYALGEQGVNIINAQFEPQFKIKEKSMVQIKVPFIMVYGELGKTNGLGDVVITYNYKLDSFRKKPLTLTLGSRIGTGTSNLKSDENLSLPMPYQISLGTTDIIIGAKYQLGKSLSVSLAMQQPLLHKNQNGFDSSTFKSFALINNLQKEENYFISSKLRRKGDMMLRIDYTKILKKAFISAGLLPIYHLGNDQIEEARGKSKAIANSKGLTLNINADYRYSFNSRVDISITAAAPLIVRKSRPDGLTRSMVLLSGLKYVF